MEQKTWLHLVRALYTSVHRTVWPVRNVVPTTAPIYPHKFPSKLTILTQARPTTTLKQFFSSSVQKPHKGSQVLWEDYLQKILAHIICFKESQNSFPKTELRFTSEVCLIIQKGLFEPSFISAVNLQARFRRRQRAKNPVSASTLLKEALLLKKR